MNFLVNNLIYLEQFEKNHPESLFINALLDANTDRKLGKSPCIRTVNDLKIPKTDYYLTDQEDEESISIDFQVCRPHECRVQYHLNIDCERHTASTTSL